MEKVYTFLDYVRGGYVMLLCFFYPMLIIVTDGRVMCLEESDIYSHIKRYNQVLNK